MFSDKNWTSHEAKLLLLAGYFVEITIKPQVFKFMFLLPIFNFLLFNFLLSRFHFSSFPFLTFPLFTFPLLRFHFSSFHFLASAFQVFYFSSFCFSVFHFFEFVNDSTFHASALSISCGNKRLFSNCFRLRNFGITSQ